MRAGHDRLHKAGNGHAQAGRLGSTYEPLHGRHTHMSDDFNFDFSGDDEVKGGSIPPNTIVTVTAEKHSGQNLKEANKERIIGEFIRAGISPNAKKKYLAIRFRVVEADNDNYIGRPVDATLWVDETEAKFRAQYSKITGQDLPQKGEERTVSAGPVDVAEALGDSSYRVKVGPGNGGYTEVKFFNEKLDRIEPPQAEISASGGGGSDAFDSGWDDGDDGDDDGF
jgi:hypothetical protein